MTGLLWSLLDSPVIVADCVEAMAAMPDCSVDAICTDPPYGLEFMGKAWDRLGGEPPPGYVERPRFKAEATDSPYRQQNPRPNYYVAGQRAQEWHEAWATEALRVLKPGGHLLAFGGSRTSHRLACAIEDAGFEIRDSIMWVYGSGFPKSLDVSKAIDRAAGAERERVGVSSVTGARAGSVIDDGKGYTAGRSFQNEESVTNYETAPATLDAERWSGWGTALKPAHEPIAVARKPLSDTVAATVLAHGTGALNIAACRVGWDGEDGSAKRKAAGYSEAAKKALGSVVASESATGFAGEVEGADSSSGRWPANVVLSHADGCVRVGTRRVAANTQSAERPGGAGAFLGRWKPAAGAGKGVDGAEAVEVWECVTGCPVAALDAQAGSAGGQGRASGPSLSEPYGKGSSFGARLGTDLPAPFYGDEGGPSRFFYCAKSSRAERSAGLDGFEESFAPTMGNGIGAREHDPDTATPKRNTHPTVKPLDLMRWLVRLVTPPGGLILDPFAGSGTTLCAAALEGFDVIGIERDPAYAAIARARFEFWASKPEGIDTDVVLRADAVSPERDGQLKLV